MSEPKASFMTRVLSRRVRWALLGLVGLGLATLFLSNWSAMSRVSETTRSAAQLQLAQYSSALTAELRQQRVVPQLLARDTTLSAALAAGDQGQLAQRLFTFVTEIDAAALIVLDARGEAVAATRRDVIGENYAAQAFYRDAMASPDTVFVLQPREPGAFGFYFARRITEAGRPLGVIVLELNLSRFERAWAELSARVLVTTPQGRVVLASEGGWRGAFLADVLAADHPDAGLEKAMKSLRMRLSGHVPDAYVNGEAVMRLQSDVDHAGWQMVSFRSYEKVRNEVNAILALVVTLFAILLAAAFYALSRRSEGRLAVSAREQAELRAMNARLQEAIAAREQAQQNLNVAEQSLKQSSKLAALGEMSAAVSHELNQPLAAMKTYLAGARLLLRRNRPDEALAAFGRLDELIERMSTITKQLKLHARKGQERLTPVQLQTALSGAVSMMAPQLDARQITILRQVPDAPVMVRGDQVRIEQVIINLLRNALDATKAVPNPQIEVALSVIGGTASMTIRDNGPGLADQTALFEPFYTTKEPGDGVGLGLAISSGIVTELGGRLTARNGQSVGAVFEIQLPLFQDAADPEQDMPAAE